MCRKNPYGRGGVSTYRIKGWEVASSFPGAPCVCGGVVLFVLERKNPNERGVYYQHIE